MDSRFASSPVSHSDLAVQIESTERKILSEPLNLKWTIYICQTWSLDFSYWRGDDSGDSPLLSSRYWWGRGWLYRRRVTGHSSLTHWTDPVQEPSEFGVGGSYLSNSIGGSDPLCYLDRIGVVLGGNIRFIFSSDDDESRERGSRLGS